MCQIHGDRLEAADCGSDVMPVHCGKRSFRRLVFVRPHMSLFRSLDHRKVKPQKGFSVLAVTLPWLSTRVS
jgi:hypothetical protein